MQWDRDDLVEMCVAVSYTFITISFALVVHCDVYLPCGAHYNVQ